MATAVGNSDYANLTSPRQPSTLPGGMAAPLAEPPRRMPDRLASSILTTLHKPNRRNERANTKGCGGSGDIFSPASWFVWCAKRDLHPHRLVQSIGTLF